MTGLFETTTGFFLLLNISLKIQNVHLTLLTKSHLARILIEKEE